LLVFPDLVEEDAPGGHLLRSETMLIGHR